MLQQIKLHVFIIVLFTIVSICVSEEILGCGGFIKSHANIDYSKVQVKL